MQIFVCDMFATDDLVEALKYYYRSLLKGDEYTLNHPWIHFDELTLHRLNDEDRYVVYGRSDPRPQLTMSLLPWQAPRIDARSAADTDFALMRLMEDPQITILTIFLPAQQKLGISAHSIEFTRVNGLFSVVGYNVPNERPPALKV